MIPRSADWKHALASAIRDPAELLALLELPPELLDGARAAARQFPLRVPRGFVARMRHGDPRDPLLRQVLAGFEELRAVPGFDPDPVDDHRARRSTGLLQKYQGRALLITTGACAVHCRYCFRRHFPYGEENASREGWREALERLAADPELSEVILSGGDPLMLDDDRLAWLSEQLAAIPHLRRLRVHTRLPVVLPERVGEGLIQALTATRLRPVMVIHCNHPQELDAETVEALARLQAAGLPLLNQAVLLAGVNDNADTLVELSETLFAAGVLPYYLHALDRVAGAAHFEVDDLRATDLHRALHGRLPGYLVPRLVREVPGAPGKTPLSVGIPETGRV